MHVLIEIAVKSLVIAGLALGLLALMKHRSAAERSWVAHIGLLALMIMAFAPLVLPSWNVEAPAVLGQAELTRIAKPAIIDADTAPRVKLEASAVAMERATASTRDKVPVLS